MEAATLLPLAQTALSIGGSLQQGSANEKAGKYEAAQLRANANARYAQGTREAQEKQREALRLLSNARAAMAGSGGVTTDAQATQQLGRIQDEGRYNALASLYDAQAEADGLRAQAAAREKGGKSANTASKFKGLSTALKFASTVWK